jgi:hypothetical protein
MSRPSWTRRLEDVAAELGEVAEEVAEDVAAELGEVAEMASSRSKDRWLWQDTGLPRKG